jgi:predicted esterase
LRRLALALLLGLGIGVALAKDPPRPSLRAIAETYAENGDLDAALAALKKEQATPQDLLETLRAPGKPEGEPKAGVQTLEIKDGTGGKTDLLVVAPSAEQIKAHAEKGLGLAVLLHGLGGSSRHTRPIAEKLAATGEVVCVAPSAQKVPPEEASSTDGIPEMFKNRHWWMYDNPRSFPLEAIRQAKALYPIDPDRVVLSGMSMGGYGTWNIGLRRPDLFAGLAPLAGGISYFTIKSDKDAVSAALCENARNTPLLSIHGNADPIVPYRSDKEACDYLESIGAKVEFRTMEGVAHDLKGVPGGNGENGEYLVQWLTKQHRNASPEAVTYVDVAERLDGSYWLRVAAREGSAKYPRLEGKVDKKKNQITITATGVELVRVYVDDRLLDLKKPVVIAVGESVRFKKKVEPDFKAILESWRSRHDEKLVYPAFVEVDPRAVQ